MTDWRDKLAGLNQSLQSKEKAVDDQKAAVLANFRKRLPELEPIMETAAQFGDAFGVDCDFEVSRFDRRYPLVRFRIKRPLLEYVVECRDGVLHESLREGEGKPKLGETTLEQLAPKRFEQRITQWVRDAAEANRRVPGRRT